MGRYYIHSFLLFLAISWGHELYATCKYSPGNLFLNFLYSTGLLKGALQLSNSCVDGGVLEGLKYARRLGFR
jgi:hypothetical protein